MLCIGIDMSKARFDGAVCVESVDHNPSFANNHKGFKALPQWLKSLAQCQSGLSVLPAGHLSIVAVPPVPVTACVRSDNGMNNRHSVKCCFAQCHYLRCHNPS